MSLPYLSAWQLLLIPAVWLIVTQRGKRPIYLAAMLATAPLILLVPILSQTFFGLFSLAQGLTFLASQTLVILASAVLTAYFYEQAVRPKIVHVPPGKRHHYLLFLVGVVLSFVMFDLLGQSLIVSLIFGMGINLLLAVRYYGDQLSEILFSLLLMGAFYLFLYALVLFDLPGETSRYWFDSQLSGAVIWGIAVEKIVVILLYGAFWGPIYVAAKDVLAKD